MYLVMLSSQMNVTETYRANEHSMLTHILMHNRIYMGVVCIVFRCAEEHTVIKTPCVTKFILIK